MAQSSPVAIFSPTVARQQRATAKDWSYIDAWLSRTFLKVNKTPPTFERNGDTLKALLALASHDEALQEERELFAALEVKALGEYESCLQEQTEHDARLDDLDEALTKEGKSALDALACTSVDLNPSKAYTENMLRSILELQGQTFDLVQDTQRIEALEANLKRELVTIEGVIEELRSSTYQLPLVTSVSTQDNQRKIKHLTSTLPEMKARLAALSAGSSLPKPGIQDIKRDEEMYMEELKVVKTLEEEVKSFRGLPHDVDLARLELEALRVELRDLMKERDSLFEGLVERESPVKERRGRAR